ncbi:hypothetical protein UFOVP116_233 [uncultured Caudovirales phage]|uniref:Uncharacterized protein n=1 Tax=uncultured Caudovirales phage TaxID=2100421 RepID=A0A6J5LAB7_9CAUD|nr:hypothetical protein UFOVP116_233 [uncultured Caudovirales phage]
MGNAICNQVGITIVTSRFDREMACVYEMYAMEPLDSITLKHMNAHAQARVPGPYRLIEWADGSIAVRFEWDSDEQQVLWSLTWL